MELLDKVFYMGRDTRIGTGSSGKVRDFRTFRPEGIDEVYVDWGSDLEGWLPMSDVVSWEKFERLGRPGW